MTRPAEPIAENPENKQIDLEKLPTAPVLKQTTSMPVAGSSGGDFKNSLAALLAKGNPMALGG